MGANGDGGVNDLVRAIESTELTGERHAESGDERRQFRDAAGCLWAASERRFPTAEWTAADEDSARAGYGVGWLWFEALGRRGRRLRLYPQRWKRLTDIALERLCDRAREIPVARG